MTDGGDASAGVLCYRCGKTEQGKKTFRLLPGSQHITLCPECYALVWGWRDKPPAAPGEAPAQQQEGKDRQ